MLESVNGVVYQRHPKTRAYTDKKKINLKHRYIVRNRRFTHKRASSLFLHQTTLILLTPILQETTAARSNY